MVINLFNAKKNTIIIIDDVESSVALRLDDNDSPMESSSILSSNDGRSTLGELAVNTANLIAVPSKLLSNFCSVRSSEQNKNTDIESGSTDFCHIDIKLGLPWSPARCSFAGAIDAFKWRQSAAIFCHVAVRPIDDNDSKCCNKIVVAISGERVKLTER
jgi:hypothetical protein